MMSYFKTAPKLIFGLAIAALLTPLFVWKGTLYPFVFPKIWLFRLIVEAMVILYVPLALSREEFRPKKSLVLLSVGLLFAAFFVSSVLGASFYKSFWSNAERMEGLFGMLHYVAFALVLAGTLKTAPERFFTLCRVFLGVGVLAVLAAIFDALDTGYMRLQGMAGNPSFFASQLMFCVVFSLLLLSRASTKKQQYAYAALALVFSAAVIATGTRGAFVGLAAGFLVFVVFNIFELRNSLSLSFPPLGNTRDKLRRESSFLRKTGGLDPRVKSRLKSRILDFLFSREDGKSGPEDDKGRWSVRSRLVALVFLAVLVLGGVWVARSRNISLQDANIRSRLTAIRISIAAWKDRPMLGWGPENYSVAFNKYIDPKFIGEFRQRQWFDRAHNKALDVLVMGGIVGTLAYLFFIGSLVFMFWRMRKSDEGGKNFAIFGISGIAAYFVHNLFVFDVHQSYLPLFLLVGYLATLRDPLLVHPGLDPGSRAHVKSSVMDSGSPDRSPGQALAGMTPLPVSTILLLSIIILAPVFWYGSVKPLKAAIAVKGAFSWDPFIFNNAPKDISEDVRFRIIVGQYKKAIEQNSYVTWESLLLLERYYVGELRSGAVPIDQELLGYLSDRLKEAIAREPLKYEAYLALGEVLGVRGSLGDEEAYKEAVAAVVKAAELAPNVPRVWIAKGTLHFGLKQNEEGIAAFRQAIELNPDISESHWTLGNAHLFIGNFKKAAEAFDEAIARGYGISNTKEYKSLLDAYSETVQYEKLEKVLVKLIELEPKNAKWHAVLAATYKGMRRHPEARAEVARAVELDASFAKEAEVFLRTLEK